MNFGFYHHVLAKLYLNPDNMHFPQYIRQFCQYSQRLKSIYHHYLDMNISFCIHQKGPSKYRHQVGLQMYQFYKMGCHHFLLSDS